METIVAMLAGFAMGASLIIAIGAQNAYLLRQGLVRPARDVTVLVAVCAGADVLLIALGVTGLGALFGQVPVILELLRWVGVAFLAWYGYGAAVRAVRASGVEVSDPGRELPSLARAVASMAAFTFLNPHVYLDTVLLLGSIANQQPSSIRAVWVLGAMLASVCWFSALGFGARWLRRLFTRALTWRILDGAIAAVMWAIALSLAFGAGR